MKDVIELQGQFYVLATSSRVDDRTRVLKHGEAFVVCDRFGDIAPVGAGELGLFHRDMRHLSRLSLSLGPDRPLLLSSSVSDDNTLLTVDLTNPDVHHEGAVVVPRGVLHIARERVLQDGVCHERLRVSSFSRQRLHLALELVFQADFQDIFAVGGTPRAERGTLLAPEVSADQVRLGYLGKDGVVRRTTLTASPAPACLRESELRFDVTLGPHEQAAFEVAIACTEEGRPPSRAHEPQRDTTAAADGAAPTRSFAEARDRRAAAHTRRQREAPCTIETSNEQFDRLLHRSRADLEMMITDTPEGPYPYAGVPWFSTVFGRDGIITALQMLWIEPRIARGVLAVLAATQAAATLPEQDAEPGKILHEARHGEMANTGEVPFGRYYGSVDATPLFLVLAGAYHAVTDDVPFLRRLWPHVERALQWIDTCGDRDQDGFVEYARTSATGLVQQGWKDSHDSVFHADGEAAEPPIALCEIQGYVYAARRQVAHLAASLGMDELARTQRGKAEQLRRRFQERFWCESLGTYALALDGAKRPCAVRTSNAGQCLATGIADPEQARRVTATLLAADGWCGWGVRTLSSREARYNPMSYHNGSVWPHDNALVAHGMARYGMKTEAGQVLGGMFDAGSFMEDYRLPELFCGFDRRPGEGPTRYPVACSPQAWASGAVFMMLRACLGLTVNAHDRRIRLHRPYLPPFLDTVTIRNLPVGEAQVDLLLRRHLHDVGVNVLERRGQVEVAIFA